MAQKVKVSTYLRNVGKSFGYAVGDTVGEMMPVVRDVARDTKSTYQDAKSSIRDISSSIRDAAKNFGNDANILSNTLDDLKSGNWYNKEREDHALDDMFGDFDFDDDWGDSDFSNDDTDDMLENDDKNTRQLMNSMDNLGSTVSKSVAYSNARSAEYIVANNRATSRAMYELTGKGFNQVSNILLNMNDTMGALVRLGEPISAHIQNSAVFYTNTTESLNKINQSLETLVKRTEYMEKINQAANSKNKKDVSRFMMGGDFSMSGYIDMVKENVQEQTDMIKGFMDLFGMSVGKNGKNTSITTMVTKGLIGKIIPEFAKETAKQFNEALNNALGNGLMRASRKVNKSGNFLVNLLAGMFLPTDKLKTDFDTSKYDKGAMQWDGVARKALVDVIPTYLAKINAQLGGEERYFNYSTGKYESITITKARRDSIYSENAKSAGGDFRREALKEAGDNEAIQKQIEAYFLAALKSNEEFYDLTKIKKMNKGADRDKKLKSLGITDEAALDTLLRVIEMANAGQYGSKNRNMMSNFERNVYQSRSNISQSMRDKEASGYDIDGRLYDGWSSEGTISGGRRGKRGKNTKEGQRYRTSSGNFASKAYGEYDLYQAKLTYDPAGAKKILSNAKSSIDALKRKRDISRAQQNANSEIMNTINNVGEEGGAGKQKASAVLSSLVESPFRVVSMAMDSFTKGINTLFWGDGNFDGLFNKITDKFKEITETIKDKLKEWLAVDDENEDSLKNSMKRQLVSMGTNVMNKAGNWLEKKNAPRRGRIAGAQAAAEWEAAMNAGYMPEGSGSGLIAGGDSDLDEAKNKLLKEGGYYIGAGMEKLRTGFGEFLSRSLFGENPEEEKQKMMKNIDENLKSSVKDIPGAKGSMGIGAITGVGVSLLTGAVVGPLAGAAIGGAIGLATKSQAFQNFLFGEGDPNSEEYKKGIMGEFGKKLKADGFKNAKGTGIGGLIGTVGGTLMGSPILGALVGSAAGYVATSEKAKSYLFGKIGENGERDDSGLFKAETLKKLKAAAPNMGAGALAGLLIGPFGLVGNIALGAGVGYLTTSQKFHEFIFGDGKENKGLAGTIHDKIVNPIDEIMHNMSIRIGTFMKNLGKSIGNKISSFFKDRVKRYKDGDRSSLIGNILGFGQKVISTPFNMVTGAIGNIANRTRNKNLNKGYGVWNKDEHRLATAAEREQMRADAGLRSSALDKAIASAGSKEELEALQKALKDLEDPGRIFKSLKNKSLSNLYQVLQNNGVSSKDADKITTLVKGDNGASRAIQYLKKCSLNRVEGKSPAKQITEIENAIRTANNEILEAKNDKNITKGTKALLRDKYGIDTSDIDLMNAGDLIDSELKHMESLSPEAIAATEDKQYHSKVESYLDKILNSITGNRAGGIDNLNKNQAGRIINKPDRNGVMRYYQLDENGKMKQISKKDAESYNLSNNDRSFTEGLYDAGETVGNAAGVVGNVAADAVVAAGKKISAGATAMAHAAQAIGSFVVGQVENGAALADEAVSDLVDSDMNSNGSYATGGTLNRLGTGVRSKFSRLKGFAKGLFSAREEESGEGSKLARLLSGGAGEEKRTEFTSNGPIQYVKSSQGEWVTDNADKETKETIKKQNTFNDAISSVTKIPSLLGSLGGLFGKIKDGLFGDGKSDKKGILGLLGGVAGGLFSFFTGKELNIKGAIGDFVKKFVTKDALSSVFTKVIAPALLVGGFFGAFDDLGRAIGNLKLFKGNDTETVFNDTEKTVTDKNGKKVLVSTKNSISSNLKRNLVTKTILGKSSVATKIIGKSAKSWGVALNKAAGKAADAGLANGIMSTISNLLKKIPGILKKIPFLPASVKENADEIVVALYSNIDDAVKAASKELAKIAKKLAKALAVIKVVYVVGKSIDAWGNAESILGITEEATIGQRCIATLIAMVNALIPVIGDLIPNKVLVNIFMAIAPKIGIDVSELQAQRDRANEEVAQYNAENGTDLSIEEYNQMNGKAGIITKAKNGIKKGWNNFKDGAKEKASAVKEMVSSAWGKTVTGFNDGIESIKNGFNLLKDQDAIVEKLLSDPDSNLSELFTVEDDPTNPMNGLMKGLILGRRISVVGILAVKKIASGIGNLIKDKVIEPVKAGFNAFTNNESTLFSAMKDGDISGLISAEMEDSEGNPLGGILNGAFGIQKVFMVIPTLVSSIGHKAFDGIKSAFGESKEIAPTFNTAIESLKAAAKEGDLAKVSAVTFDGGEGAIGTYFNIAFGINKAVQTIGAVINKIIGPIKEVVGGVVDNVSGVVDSAKEFVGDKVNEVKEGVKTKVNNVKEGAYNLANNAWHGLTSWYSGGASGFVSQFDPRYQQYRIGGSNFAGKGCGPAVAAMTASALGKNLSVGNAVSASNGYQTAGGVTLDYFQNALGSQGIDTQVIAGGGAGDLYSNIARGKKVILLGQDATNTSKAYSPFGPNNHYVLATGLDRRGNIIVNDPESNGPRTYSPGILRNTKYGVVAGRGSGIRRYNRSMLRRIAGGASVANNENTQQIWAYLTTKLGMSESAAAGVMGNMQAESGCQPDRNQKGGPAYGLCQWEGGRKSALMALPNYSALSTQLDYMASELPSQPWKKSGTVNDIDGKSYNYSSMSYEEFKQLTDVATATIKFEAAFERAGKPRLANRINFAKEFYEMFTGKSYTYDESSASASVSNGSSESGESGSTGGFKSKGSTLGLLGTVASAFSNAFGKIFNGGSDDSDTSGVSNYESSEGGVDNTDGKSFNIGSANFNGKTPSEIMKSILGKISYSMKGPRDPEQGSADCSSTVRWAIKKAGGPDIGGSTPAQYNNKNLNTVWYGNGGYANSLPTGIQPNDVLFFARPNSDYTVGRQDRVGHVGIYEGDGKYIDHGSGMGPREKTLKFGDAGKLIKVARVNTSGANSGILNYSDLASRAAGSSGLLISSRAGSRQGMSSIRDPRTGRLIPVSRVSGGASAITADMLNGIASGASNYAKSGGVSPELVTQLLASITNILNNIAQNTAPVNKIYQALVAYLEAGGSSGASNDVVRINNTSSQKAAGAEMSDVDANIKTLVTTLAELAKG